MFDGYAFSMLPGFAPPRSSGNAKILNTIQCRDVFNRITNAALARYKWKNLPKSCNERSLEITLYFYGFALFFNDEDLGYIHTPCNLPGPFNVYYESIRREAYSYEYRKTYNQDNSVIVRSNITMTPDYLITWTYAPKIADGLRAIDVHAQTIKSPFGIACDEQDKKSAIAAVNKIQSNEIAIFSNKFSKSTPFQVLNFASNCWLPEMWNNVKNYFEQCYSSLGIESIYSSKKERLVSSESEGQTNPTRHVLQSGLESRKRACAEINDMFGLNIDVNINQETVFVEEELYSKGLLIEKDGEDDV